MIVLLAAGIGVCIVGLLAFGFGIPISDTSFGNALLIAGVVVFCTGLILVGMWLVARELVGLTRLVLAQGTGAQAPRPAVPSRPANPFAAPAAAHSNNGGALPPPPPWADEAAARAKTPPPMPDVQAAEPPAPPPPPAPDRPARRNLLFATKRRDKDEPAASPPLPSTALEAEPKVSFENAWPNPSRANGAAAAERQEPAAAAASEPAAADEPTPDLPPGVTVVKSGVVDGMAYTLYSDGSIEAQFAGEKAIRFASFDALRVHVEQQRQ
jgi:hypothetical protein